MSHSVESLHERVAKLEERTKTQLLDTRLWVRAFTVYGYYLLAGLMIIGIMFVIGLVIFLLGLIIVSVR